jgi:ferredoxin
MKVTVDTDLCQGHSVCLHECPEVFSVVEQEGSYAVVNLLLEEPPEALREKVMNAARYCPNRVISVEE